MATSSPRPREDRIAAAAKSNKAQIYHYFGSKDALFDGYEDHPEVQRLATWYRLERAETESPLDVVVASNRAKVDAIASAQRSGSLPSHFAAEDLLAIVLTIASMWTSMTPEYNALVSRHTRPRRRQVVIDAVRTLLA